MGVVLTTGGWDLFHIGHLNYLEKCKELGNFLIVGVNTGELIELYKDGPPIISLEERLRIVGGLKCVDMVFLRDTVLDAEVADKYNVEIFVRSTDFGRMEDSHRNLRELVEKNVQIVVIPRTPNVSSQKIREDCRKGERLIEGRVNVIEPSGAIYIDGRGLQHRVKIGDNIAVYKRKEKDG